MNTITRLGGVTVAILAAAIIITDDVDHPACDFEFDVPSEDGGAVQHKIDLPK